MIFFTSDLHIGHNRAFLYEKRGFNNIQDHDDALVKNWNSVVREEDEVYILGDIMLNDDKHGIEYFNQLNGIKHIILGNHDTAKRQKLFTELNDVKDIKLADMFGYGKFKFFLCHYPVMTAFMDDKKISQHLICLCGHTHFEEKFYYDNPYVYNVALDAHNMFPIDIETIIKDVKEKVLSEKCKNVLNTLDVDKNQKES